MGLFIDADGIPLTCSIFNGNENEQPSMKPLEKKVLSDFGIKRFIVCTDAGLSSIPNRTNLEDEGWHLSGSQKTFRISELDEQSCYDKTFYKDRWINEDGLEQHLVVTFSFKYRDYHKEIRSRQLERATKLADNPSVLKRNRPNDPKRFVRQDHCTSDGEIADQTIVSIDEGVVKKEEQYDGFYAVCTNLEDEVSTIININQKRWQIEECFRIMKSEFYARPVYLSRKDRIAAHFITCFTSLILYRILEKKLGDAPGCDDIIKTLKEMNMLVMPGEGYIPEYTRTDLTDMLHDTFSFRTDYEIVSQRNMKKILTATRK